MRLSDWIRVIAFMTFAKVFGLDEDDLPDPVRPEKSTMIKGAYSVLLRPGLRKDMNEAYYGSDD